MLNKSKRKHSILRMLGVNLHLGHRFHQWRIEMVLSPPGIEKNKKTMWTNGSISTLMVIRRTRIRREISPLMRPISYESQINTLSSPTKTAKNKTPHSHPPELQEASLKAQTPSRSMSISAEKRKLLQLPWLLTPKKLLNNLWSSMGLMPSTTRHSQTWLLINRNKLELKTNEQ